MTGARRSPQVDLGKLMTAVAPLAVERPTLWLAAPSSADARFLRLDGCVGLEGFDLGVSAATRCTSAMASCLVFPLPMERLLRTRCNN